MIKNTIKTIYILIITISFTIPAMAQTITGLIKDTESIPISYATVVLCTITDTTQVSYAVTDQDGCFSLKPQQPGEYLLHVSFIGYKPQYRIAQSDQVIILEQDALALDEVVVKASRPIAKITAGGVQTLVANTVLSEMGTGNDVLKRIPMVTGDHGVFKVFGRGEATLYINNREVRDPSELENLNSADIQSVEVISNPGSNYNASVKAVIYIKTVRKQGDGLGFNVRSSFYTWKKQDYSNQLNLNYRKGGFDLFITLLHSDITNLQSGNLMQVTILDSIWKQQSFVDGTTKRNRLDGILGVNYEIDKDHQIGFRYDLKSSPNQNVEQLSLRSNVYADEKLFDQWENNEIKKLRNKVGSQANLYYTGKIEKLAIDFNSDFMDLGSRSSNLNTEKSEQYGDRILHSSNVVENRLWAVKLQLVYPVWKGKLSAGSEYVNMMRSDEYLNTELIGFSSKVDISEQNLAFFTQYQAETEIGYFSAGIRYENADYDYLIDELKETDKSRKYKQFFPSFSYSNRFGVGDQAVSMQLSYGSNIKRPSYGQLSNNLLYANRFTIQTGNPYLKPTISHDLSLMGIWRFIQAQVSYSYQKDAIVMWIDRYKDDPKISLVTYKNLSELPTLSAFVTLAPAFGFYKPKLSIGVEKYWQDYRKFGLEGDMKDPFFMTSLNNTFELPYDVIINLDAQFTGKGYYLVAYLENSFKLDFGISKRFFKKNLQVKLAFTDITNQSSATTHVVMPQTTLKSAYQFDNREVSLTLRYNFNPSRSKYKGSGAGQAAKNRF